MFNATFNNTAVISWPSVVSVEKTTIDWLIDASIDWLAGADANFANISAISWREQIVLWT